MANENVAARQNQALTAIREIDAINQCTTKAIKAMALAAQQMLALNASSLDAVNVLLREIVCKADGHQNDVNFIAEQHDANWLDPDADAVSRRLWAQHHELHGKLDVQHG